MMRQSTSQIWKKVIIILILGLASIIAKSQTSQEYRAIALLVTENGDKTEQNGSEIKRNAAAATKIILEKGKEIWKTKTERTTREPKPFTPEQLQQVIHSNPEK